MMKKFLKRSLSALLVFSMTISACMVSASDVQAGELSGDMAEEEIEISEPDDVVQDSGNTNETPQEEAKEETAQDISADSETDILIDETEDETEPEEDTEINELAATPVAEYSLNLQYDDYYTLSDLITDLKDYPIMTIESSEVVSYQVSGGEVSDDEDEIIRYDQETGTIVATGVGSAVVTFSETEPDETDESGDKDSESDETPTNSGDYITLEVTVEPATLTMMFIAGQSNAEGYTSDATGAHPEDSIVCEEGKVYSTYAPSSSGIAQSATGISSFATACTVSNAEDFVAGSLTGTESLSGKDLVYPLNALTKSGNGKTGMDSGLAYEWTESTKDKVWVVNAAYSATSITKWIPGGDCYERANQVFRDAMKTAAAEEDAGHYILKNRLMFWLQGEDDTSMSVSEYTADFKNMYNGFDNALYLDECGIIIVRAAATNGHTTSADIAMTSPRTAQYLMGNSNSDSEIYVVSNANEKWVTDSGVRNYFQGVYGSSLSYPLRSNTTLSGLPTSVTEVHADIHYSQVAHNENGITAAENMLSVTGNSGGTLDAAIYWYDSDGTAHESGSTVYTEDGENTLVPVVDPLYLSKEISVASDSSELTYNADKGTVSGSGVLTATIGDISSNVTVNSNGLATPPLKSAVCSNGQITITWDSVSEADGYRVYRKTSGGSWEAIGYTDSLSYTDSDKLEIGTTYYYTVRAYRGDYSKALANTYSSKYWSDFESAGVSATAEAILSTPVLNKATVSSGTVTVIWNAVSGADGYRVYRKPSGGSWAAIGYSTNTSYTDNSNLEAGTTYYYTVRAYKGDYSTAVSNAHYASYWSEFDTKGVSTTVTSSLDTPHLVKASASSGTITVTWNAVSNASGYRVYRKTSGGSWAAIGTSTSTSYKDSNKLDVGTTYYYTVRAYKGDYSTALANTYGAAYWSGFESAGVSAKVTGALSTPSLKSATTSGGSNKVTWGSVSGASGYRVYRKPSGGSWAAIGTTTSTSYTDSGKFEIGTTYYYTVRAYKGDQSTAIANAHYSSYWSDFDSKGVSVKTAGALSTPSLKSATTSGGSNKVTWGSVSGASGYRVYRKPSGGSWAAIGTTTSTSYTDSGKLDIGTTYYYTVRAYKGDQSTAIANAHYSSYWSDFDSKGVSVKTAGALSTPSLNKATSSLGKITVTWGSVSGASGYRIYRKPSGGSWAAIGTSTSASYTDDTSNVDVGTTYYYTVRAYKGDQSTAIANAHYSIYWSDFVSAGVSAKVTSELATPTLSKATASTAKNTVSWSSVSNASGYRIYRKTSGGSWAAIGNTTDTSYTDSTNLEAGTTYYYTVRAYKGDYSTALSNTYKAQYWSDFDSSGVSATAISVLSTPSLKSASKTSSGVEVTYGSVSGAGGYRVYRKVSGGSWSAIGYTTSTSYTDTSSLSSGKVYYYTVRAYVGSYSTAINHTYDVNYWSAFDTSGVKYSTVTVADTDMYDKAQSYSSSSQYLIMINTKKNKLGVFVGSKGDWEMKYYWSCSTGKASTPTGIGTFKIGYKGKSFGDSHTCWYYSQFNGSQLMHSVLYKKGSMTVLEDGRLGVNISHGCVRLALSNAKWIYDNAPKGTTVVGYK